MTDTISWLHVGDLHMDEADGLLSRGRLDTIVAIANRMGKAIDFVYLPGDNANHATPAQYAAITDALGPLARPWRAIPGDHDFEGGDLSPYEAAFPAANRPAAEVIAGHRCIFLDIVSAGAGGPDFRLTMHDRNRLRDELARAQGEGQTSLVFMHAYPCDLAADGVEVAEMLAEGQVAFVDTGHTHYNELLNDGRVVYGATRSTAQIEEGDGKPGYAIVTVHRRIPSWRFVPFDVVEPLVQIVAPADYRLATRTTDPLQVPRPGAVEIVAKLFGETPDAGMTASAGNEGQAVMARGDDGLWRTSLPLSAGLNDVTVRAGGNHDTIRVLVRPADDLPHRGPRVAPGHAVHAIGAWPERGIDGAQLGPNRNGRRQ